MSWQVLCKILSQRNYQQLQSRSCKFTCNNQQIILLNSLSNSQIKDISLQVILPVFTNNYDLDLANSHATTSTSCYVTDLHQASQTYPQYQASTQHYNHLTNRKQTTKAQAPSAIPATLRLPAKHLLPSPQATASPPRGHPASYQQQQGWWQWLQISLTGSIPDPPAKLSQMSHSTPLVLRLLGRAATAGIHTPPHYLPA